MSKTPAKTRDQNLEDAVAQARADYVAANPISQSLFEEAKDVMPGANTRTVLHYEPFPVTIVKGAGARIWDADAHVYCDFLGEYTAGLYGHDNQVIVDAVRTALDGGLTLGGPKLVEAKLARLMCERFPALERLRFCNSGTEANVLSLGAARAFTRRSEILVADGSYHGSVLTFAGDSPLNLPFPIHRMTYNETEAAVARIRRLGTRLAAVLVEPMIGAGGAIPGTKEFLQGLRAATEECGALLIFDEVMTSRLTAGGLHGYHGIKPDLVSFGKYLGGGLGFGAFGGRSDILDNFDPARRGAWPHAGTFNNNILSMTAGHVGLHDVYTAEAADAFFVRGNAFRRSLVDAVAELDLPVHVTGLGSMMAFHFTRTAPAAPPDPTQVPLSLRELVHLDMLARGQYFARRGMINLSLPMTDADLNDFRSAFVEVLKHRAPVIRSALG